ncbi:uncharacterized protein ACWYII_019917 [Salvelinus alpinus]
MFVLKFTVGLLTLMLVSSAWVEELTEVNPMFFLTEIVVEEDTSIELSVGELLTRADRDLTPEADEPTLMGDIAMPSEKNAKPCTATGCLWQKYSDGRIWMAYVIANTSVSVSFSSREIAITQRGLDSFAETTCVRFLQCQNERDYLSIESRSGCYSYVGRQGNTQTVSLAHQGCLYHSTVQHELLHALGFNHEQTRSDLDNHIHVYWENIIDDELLQHRSAVCPLRTHPVQEEAPPPIALAAAPLNSMGIGAEELGGGTNRTQSGRPRVASKLSNLMDMSTSWSRMEQKLTHRSTLRGMVEQGPEAAGKAPAGAGNPCTRQLSHRTPSGARAKYRWGRMTPEKVVVLVGVWLVEGCDLCGYRYAFSKNNRPTMEPIPNNNVSFGEATQMSKNDIDRLNRLYGCCEYCHTEQFTVHGFG